MASSNRILIVDDLEMFRELGAIFLALQLASLDSWSGLGRSLVTGENSSYQDWQDEAMPFLEQDKQRRGE